MILFEFQKLIGNEWFQKLINDRARVVLNSDVNVWWMLNRTYYSGKEPRTSNNFHFDKKYFPFNLLDLEFEFNNHLNQKTKYFKLKEAYKLLSAYI